MAVHVARWFSLLLSLFTIYFTYRLALMVFPGRNMLALLAAVHPEPTKALYFVSRGDGSSEFSDDLAAHNRAVNRYQRK